MGPDRQARVQPEPLRRLEHGRQQPRDPVRDRRAEAAGLLPGPGRRRATRSSPAREARNPGGDNCTIWASFARRGLGYSAVQGTTDRNDNTEAFDTHPDCQRNFQAPVLPEPALNDRPAGSTVDLRFTADGYRGLDVLAENQPYSRQVDCTTLKTVNPGPDAITPRPYPVKAIGALSVNAAASSPSRGRPRPPGPAPAARWWPRPTPASSTGRTSASRTTTGSREVRAYSRSTLRGRTAAAMRGELLGRRVGDLVEAAAAIRTVRRDQPSRPARASAFREAVRLVAGHVERRRRRAAGRTAASSPRPCRMQQVAVAMAGAPRRLGASRTTEHRTHPPVAMAVSARTARRRQHAMPTQLDGASGYDLLSRWTIGSMRRTGVPHCDFAHLARSGAVHDNGGPWSTSTS